MSEVETDHESDRINNTGGTDNDLTTDGAISLFTSALNNALDREKATLIEHFENSLVKNEKATRVDTAEFSFKHEGNKIQYSFNLERLEKLSRIENNKKLNKLNAVYAILTEEQTMKCNIKVKLCLLKNIDLRSIEICKVNKLQLHNTPE
jgi:hypothetical protein